jgi:4-hydroxy 2-oxovalerate aldolase
LRHSDNDGRDRRRKMSEPTANVLQSKRSQKVNPDPKGGANQKMKIMDVTFRESVLCQKQIGMEAVLSTLQRLSETGIDYIEIGYLKFGSDSNPLLNYSPDYIARCYDICKGKVKIGAMIHPDDFSPDKYDIDTVKQLSFIRVTSTPKNMDKIRDISGYFKPRGIKVSMNLLRASKFSDEQSLEYCGRAQEFGADFFYIADSNGHFLPHQVRSRIAALKENFPDMTIGFHPHDNLGLAGVNAIEAVQGGADIVDSSLMGYGKGAGNLRTELFPLVLGRLTGRYKIEEIHTLFKVARYFYHNVVSPNTFEEEYKFSLYGLFDIDLDVDKKICEVSGVKGLEDHELAFDLIRQSNGDIGNLDGLLKKLAS